MTTIGSQTVIQMPPRGLSMTDPGQEAYEQLLAFADTIGAACAEAYQQIGAAYIDACQQLGLEIVGLQDGLADHPNANPFSAIIPPASSADRLNDMKENTLAMGESVAGMSRQIGLTYLDAFEQAALAAANCHEQIGAASGSDFLNATGAACADLARKLARAGTGALREMAV